MTDRYQALRDALAAGPTPGRREARYDHPESRTIVNIVIPDAEMYPVNVATGFAIETAEERANIALLAAADPETIAALLKERDELKIKAGGADLCLESVYEARQALKEHFGGNLAFLDDDLVRGVVKMKQEIDAMRAARIAYANEFDPISDGDDAGLPDVGSIHQNIRALKAERDALLTEVASLRHENHNLNWALGTDGYSEMFTPEEREENAEAERNLDDWIRQLLSGKPTYAALKAERDALREALLGTKSLLAAFVRPGDEIADAVMAVAESALAMGGDDAQE